MLYEVITSVKLAFFQLFIRRGFIHDGIAYERSHFVRIQHRKKRHLLGVERRRTISRHLLRSLWRFVVSSIVHHGYVNMTDGYPLRRKYAAQRKA